MDEWAQGGLLGVSRQLGRWHVAEAQPGADGPLNRQ